MIYFIKKTKNALSIIEITIVMIVIGLLSVSVLTGAAIIEQAKLRVVNTELTGYKEAYYVFKLAYECIPGDCANIANLLPHNDACEASAAAAGKAGNGDEQLVEIQERRYFWCHLMLAGNESNIPKLTYDADVHFVPGINIPLSKSVEGGYSVGFFSKAGKSGEFNANGLILLNIADAKDFINTTARTVTADAKGALTPSQTKSLFTKYDVIAVDQGSYRAENSAQTDGKCYNATDGIFTNNKTNECVVIFRLEEE